MSVTTVVAPPTKPATHGYSVACAERPGIGWRASLRLGGMRAAKVQGGRTAGRLRIRTSPKWRAGGLRIAAKGPSLSEAAGPLRSAAIMKLLCCHPSGLMYTEAFLRLEPLGLELVAAAAQRAGHEVRTIDLQVFAHDDYWRLLAERAPDAVAFSLNYLANVPEVIDLVKERPSGS